MSGAQVNKKEVVEAVTILETPPPLGLLANVLSPDGLQRAQATGGHDVADHADAHHGRSLQDGHRLDDLLLVHLGAGSVHLADDVCHTSLVTHEACQVHRFGRVILREALYLTPVTLGTLFGEEPL